jgi:hypothetical protein
MKNFSDKAWSKTGAVQAWGSEKCEGVDKIQLAYDGVQWCDYVNTAVKRFVRNVYWPDEFFYPPNNWQLLGGMKCQAVPNTVPLVACF